MMSPLFRRLPLSFVLLGLALVGIAYCYEISERGGSRWQSVPVVCFSPDGKSLAAGMYNGRFVYAKGTYYLADLCATSAVVSPGAETPTNLLEQALTPGIWNGLPEIAIGRFVDWSPDGNFLAVGGVSKTPTDSSFQAIVRLYKTSDLGLIAESATDSQLVHSVRFSPDGKTLATSFRYWIQLRDPQMPQDSRNIELGASVAGFSFSPDGKILAANDRGSSRVEFWNIDATSPKRIALYEETDPEGLPDSSTALAFSPDGKTLACAGERNIRLLNVTAKTLRHTLNERLVLALAYSPDGKLLATGRYDGVQLWNADTGERIGPRIKTSAVESVAFSPDSRTLATGDVEGNITLWNVADRTKTWSTHLEGRHRVYMPLSAPPVMLGVWLAICAILVWRRNGRGSVGVNGESLDE